MTEHEKLRLKSWHKKLVSNSRAILSKQIFMPYGSLKMEKIINTINQIKPITELDLEIFSDYNNQTGEYPIGEDRIRYNEEFLAKLDLELEKVTMYFKEKVEEKCHEIIKKFGIEKN